MAIQKNIEKFNDMYSIPTVTHADELLRLNQFKDIFLEEISEKSDILSINSTIPKTVAVLDWVGDLMIYCLSESDRWEFAQHLIGFEKLLFLYEQNKNPKNIRLPNDYDLNRFADNLSEVLQQPLRGIIRGFASRILFEAMFETFLFSKTFNISLFGVIGIIMESNFSKLGEDGKPIFDDRGKLLKGPNFKPPELELETYLRNNWGINGL